MVRHPHVHIAEPWETQVLPLTERTRHHLVEIPNSLRRFALADPTLRVDTAAVAAAAVALDRIRQPLWRNTHV